MTPQTFVRDRFTWLAYFMLAYYAYIQATLGPAMPFLGDELSMSYTVRGLHLSAFALGMILAGMLGDRVAARASRRLTFWFGTGGMAAGAVAFTLMQTPALTILSAFFMGTFGSFLLVMIQAGLAHHHGNNRAIPLTESNVMASIAATAAPFLISQLERLALGWRAALWLGAATAIAAWLVGRRYPFPEDGKRTPGLRSRSRLPRLFWLYWLVALFSVAVEWCTLFWGPDFLERVVGFERTDAVGAMAIFLAATVIGRFVGSRLTFRFPAPRLLIVAAGITLIGFPLFWLGYETPAIALIGLFLMGLGIANLYPLTLATTTTVGAANPDAASSRTSLAAGLAILIAPQVLGTFADQSGIYSAFAIAGALAAFVLVITVLADRFGAQRA